MGKKKRNLNQKGVDKMQEQDKKELETTENVEENDSSTEQKQVDSKENAQEPVTEPNQEDNKEKEAPKKDKPAQTKSKEKLILVKGKVAEKGSKSFLRCGVKFTNEYQELEVDKSTLARLKLEPKLTIQVVK